MRPPASRQDGGRRVDKVSRAGTAFVLGAAVLWGTIGVAGRLAFRAGVSPLEAALFRAAIAFVTLLGWMLATNRHALRVRPHDVWLFAAFGFVSIAVFFYAYLFAISQTTVATAAILLYTAPAFVILISAVVLHEPITAMKAGALLLAFVGCVLVVGAYRAESMRFSIAGVLAGLLSGFTYAMYSIFGKLTLSRYGTLTTLTYALGFGALFLGTAALLTHEVTWSLPLQGWEAVAYLGLVTTLLAQGLYLSGLRYLEAGRASLIATLEPVVAAALGYLVLLERVGVLQVLGGVLIIAAVLVVYRTPYLRVEERS